MADNAIIYTPSALIYQIFLLFLSWKPTR